MKKSYKPRSTVLTVVGAVVALVLFGGGTAVAGGLITSAKIKNNTIQSIDVKNEGLTGADVKNYSLTNQDVGVLFAQVNADATIANSSGQVSGSQPYGTGTYEIDFHRNISKCAFTATVGDPDAGNTQGVVTVATDRSGNVGAVFLRTTDLSFALTNRPFQLVVVC